MYNMNYYYLSCSTKIKETMKEQVEKKRSIFAISSLKTNRMRFVAFLVSSYTRIDYLNTIDDDRRVCGHSIALFYFNVSLYGMNISYTQYSSHAIRIVKSKKINRYLIKKL